MEVPMLSTSQPPLSPSTGTPDLRPADSQNWREQTFSHFQFDVHDTFAANARGELTPLQRVNVQAATPGAGPGPLAVFVGIMGLMACFLALGVGLQALVAGSVAG